MKTVLIKDWHFVNMFDREEARRYKDKSTARRILSNIAAYGGAENNDFEIVPV